MVSLSHDETLSLVPDVVVVDPQFQAYGPLVAAARAGRLNLHLRATGAEALRLARRLNVDAWLISTELDDMTGNDLVALLNGRQGRSSQAIAFVTSSDSTSDRNLGVATTLRHPISLDAVDEVLRSPSKDSVEVPMGCTDRPRAMLALPIGVGAAVLAIATFMLG